MIAGEVKRYRRDQEMTADQVVEACTRLGLPMRRTVLTNLETGRRGNVTLAELLTLARVLRVPPTQLFLPLGREKNVEILDGAEVSTWSAYRWVTGEDRFPSPYTGDGDLDPATGLYEWYDDPERDWEDGATPTLLFRQHFEAIRDWYAVPTQVKRLDLDPIQKAELRDARQQLVEQRLGTIRLDMRRLELTPPDLPDDLASRPEVNR